VAGYNKNLKINFIVDFQKFYSLFISPKFRSTQNALYLFRVFNLFVQRNSTLFKKNVINWFLQKPITIKSLIDLVIFFIESPMGGGFFRVTGFGTYKNSKATPTPTLFSLLPINLAFLKNFSQKSKNSSLLAQPQRLLGGFFYRQ